MNLRQSEVRVVNRHTPVADDKSTHLRKDSPSGLERELTDPQRWAQAPHTQPAQQAVISLLVPGQSYSMSIPKNRLLVLVFAVLTMLPLTAGAATGATDAIRSPVKLVRANTALGSATSYPLTPFVVVADYDPPPQNWLPGHRGIDLQAFVGQNVAAVADSHVHFAGTVAGRGVLSLRLSSGDLVSMEPVSTPYQTGDTVLAGAEIATVSSTGQDHCAVPECLHVGLRRNGEYLNPLILWPERRPPIVLLPTR